MSLRPLMLGVVQDVAMAVAVALSASVAVTLVLLLVGDTEWWRSVWRLGRVVHLRATTGDVLAHVVLMAFPAGLVAASIPAARGLSRAWAGFARWSLLPLLWGGFCLARLAYSVIVEHRVEPMISAAYGGLAAVALAWIVSVWLVFRIPLSRHP